MLSNIVCSAEAVVYFGCPTCIGGGKAPLSMPFRSSFAMLACVVCTPGAARRPNNTALNSCTAVLRAALLQMAYGSNAGCISDRRPMRAKSQQSYCRSSRSNTPSTAALVAHTNSTRLRLFARSRSLQRGTQKQKETSLGKLQARRCCTSRKAS